MSEIDKIKKAIKACKEEIKFYKNELKQPYLNEYLSTYDAYIKGQNEAYSKCCDGIETFEFIVSILEEKQKREQGCEHCKPTLAFGIIFDQKRTPYEPVSMNYCPFCGRRLNHE